MEMQIKPSAGAADVQKVTDLIKRTVRNPQNIEPSKISKKHKIKEKYLQTPTAKKPPKREWAPRFWLGCDTFAWVRLMSKGHFAWHAPHWYIGASTFAVSLGHTVLKWFQQGLYGSKIQNTKFKEDPVFIVGHWRTGTTLLHELLITDPNHNFPNTYQCMEPNHFLLTEEISKKYLGFLMPDHRPMDNMKAGWDRPQEDEFALCMLGLPSPYLHVAFPNQPPIDQNAFDISSLPRSTQRTWKKYFYRYLQTLTFRDPRRLILKSPPHSCRIPMLLELFPKARFVHIVRNPYSVYPSTVRLWKSLYLKHGMQNPDNRGVEEYVYSTFLNLYDKLEEGRKQVPANQFYEIRYEDLIANPLQEMESLYQHLNLGDFGRVKPFLQSYLDQNATYETNRYELSNEETSKITQRWGRVIEHYGYPLTKSDENPDKSSLIEKISPTNPTIPMDIQEISPRDRKEKNQIQLTPSAISPTLNRIAKVG